MPGNSSHTFFKRCLKNVCFGPNSTCEGTLNSILSSYRLLFSSGQKFRLRKQTRYFGPPITRHWPLTVEGKKKWCVKSYEINLAVLKGSTLIDFYFLNYLQAKSTIAFKQKYHKKKNVYIFYHLYISFYSFSRHRAVYTYKPTNEDEVELKVGDIVHVLEKCDDGWFIGTSQRTGVFGTFPGNYVLPA